MTQTAVKQWALAQIVPDIATASQMVKNRPDRFNIEHIQRDGIQIPVVVDMGRIWTNYDDAEMAKVVANEATVAAGFPADFILIEGF